MAAALQDTWDRCNNLNDCDISGHIKGRIGDLLLRSIKTDGHARVRIRALQIYYEMATTKEKAAILMLKMQDKDTKVREWSFRQFKNLDIGKLLEEQSIKIDELVQVIEVGLEDPEAEIQSLASTILLHLFLTCSDEDEIISLIRSFQMLRNLHIYHQFLEDNIQVLVPGLLSGDYSDEEMEE
eukprot:TRINITY_DN723_c0_g1_i4.p1 TRINITY_DN723_c0_g1~~TRINITY_DN723_c0_g1_i4.p1  ORF type:complete len:183 (-),score=34.60 TRINITY_DN723_c0_g1_i4:135-683(-)